ncbi:hypothetical protein O3M35_010205 [Rhynocoris fuscipes]|uniref:Peptidase S1 domain-containing protein n=1 Tax=Rhynocoris fuscipes TaxID=488301 RepID=A0AAW1D5S9_9HEMI
MVTRPNFEFYKKNSEYMAIKCYNTLPRETRNVKSDKKFSRLSFQLLVKKALYSIIEVNGSDGKGMERSWSWMRTWGGTAVNSKDVPFLVIVNSCSGSLIHPEWIVTSAHCINPLHSVTVKYGSTISFRAKAVMAKHAVIHPNYSYDNILNTYLFDIALIKLFEPLELSDNVQIINIDDKEWPCNMMYTRICNAIGFGLDKYSNRSAHISKFKTGHGLYACKGIEYEQIVCVQAPMDDGLCPGDSGGPLICEDKLVAICAGYIEYSNKFSAKTQEMLDNTFRISCNFGNRMLIFTYICPKLDWIKSYVNTTPWRPASCSTNSLYKLVGFYMQVFSLFS